jgi:hypothetical protein
MKRIEGAQGATPLSSEKPATPLNVSKYVPQFRGDLANTIGRSRPHVFLNPGMQRYIDGYIAREAQDVHETVNLCADLLRFDRQ